MIKSIVKLWNKNFDEGATPFQIVLMIFMIIGAIQGNQRLILFCMFNILFGYLEPRQPRFRLGGKR